MIEKFFLIFLISFLNFMIIQISMRFLIPIFRQKLIDKPNQRSIHKRPKPTGGAIIIVVSSSLVYIFVNLFFKILGINLSMDISNINYIFIISSIVGILGFIDDIYDLKNKLKFLLQISVAILFINYLNVYLIIEKENYLFILTYLFLIIFISGSINIINFMDGIDGLICGVFSIIFLILSIKINIYYLPLSAGLFSFLIFNWYPSIIFMGDTGSTYIGAIFAGQIISLYTFQESISVLLLASPLLMDSSICILRRFINGHNIFAPHKLHLYQRLVENGMSHDKVSIIYISSCSFIAIFYLADRFLLELSSTIIILGLGIFLDKKYAISFKKR